ncbi:hypothetical protein [Candidatus Parabeggiatoa sp. HSG14]|uniref:hypothetical protein n=1 Tax=Candidatus Parabeggiatoa sp. HSG14 TaxID=3055593 RepID=UPI0025A6CA03|nr:hypothetical protein [Thiotrichales bacterium HSG14]
MKWLPNATKAQVLNGLKWIRKTAIINDVAVLFFAGIFRWDKVQPPLNPLLN